MELLFLPLQLFVWNPIAVFLTAGIFLSPCFLRAFGKPSRRVALVVGSLWLCYGFWETYMTHWRSATGDRAIRVDLVLFGPVLLLAALVWLITLWKGLRRAS